MVWRCERIHGGDGASYQAINKEKDELPDCRATFRLSYSLCTAVVAKRVEAVRRHSAAAPRVVALLVSDSKCHVALSVIYCTIAQVVNASCSTTSDHNCCAHIDRTA